MNDYGSELASFHSQGDDDSYFDIIENPDPDYSEHPYGLRFMDCTIGLTNRSYEDTWQWYDGTAYDWGVKGSATDKWDSDTNPKDFRCVLINNALNRKEWGSFACGTQTDVHCGVCATPRQRPYVLELEGTWDDTGTNGYVLLWVQLNGTDLFETGVNSIEFFKINITGDASWSHSIEFSNYSNIGPIDTITFLIRNGAANITIDQVRINYFKDRAGSPSIHLETEGSSSCDYRTITIQYIYQNYTIDDGTDYDDACVYGLNFLPTTEPTSIPSVIPSSIPTNMPSGVPSKMPTDLPSSTPTGFPSITPTGNPTSIPSELPTNNPSYTPTHIPSSGPTAPSTSPTHIPSSNPTFSPTLIPSSQPSAEPSYGPTVNPGMSPTEIPTQIPVDTGSTGGGNGESNTIVLLLMAFGLFVLIVICGTIVICWYLRNTREQLKQVKQQHGLSYDDGAGIVNDPTNPKYQDTVSQRSNSQPMGAAGGAGGAGGAGPGPHSHSIEMQRGSSAPQEPDRQHSNEPNMVGAHNGAQGAGSIPGMHRHASQQPGGGKAKEGGHTETREGQQV